MFKKLLYKKAQYILLELNVIMSNTNAIKDNRNNELPHRKRNVIKLSKYHIASL